MRKKIFAFALLCSASLLAMAQGAYKLTDMSQEDFCNGGAQGFSFQQYTPKGGFSNFALCDEQSTVNYVDIYQVEYVGGKIIAEFDGIKANGENTWASNTRTAWYNKPFESVRTDSKEKFVYVGYDPREGYGMEINANDEYAAAISFTAPKDGYYRFDGKVIRVDNSGEFGSLDLVPMFRYAAQPDNVIKTGLSYSYGFTGGAWEKADGNFNLSKGGTRRYVAEQPTAFSFTAQVQKGDIISFVESCENTGVMNSFARAFMARSFVQQLDATEITAEEAAAAATYLDPYAEVDIDALYEYMDSLELVVSDWEIGDGVGQYSQESIDEFKNALEEISKADATGLITKFTIDSYYKLINDAYEKLQKSINQFDLTLEGNYALVNTVTDEEGNVSLVCDAEVMAQNEDQPWGFFRHDNVGNYYRLENHNTGNKSGESAWYVGANDWFYITDKAAMHPTTSQAPTITFTAPKDGVYRLVYGVYRQSPNAKVENPLYIRNFFHKEGLQPLTYKTGESSNAIFSQEFGSVANDGQGGKAPIKGDFFVNMKQGDVITTELDCYTSGRNSSAGTQITRLYVLSQLNEEEAYTVEYAKQSGIAFFDLYAVGDTTQLSQAITEARAAITLIGVENIGEGSGKYSQTAYDKLLQLIQDGLAAVEAAENGDSAWDQAALDRLAALIQAATTDFSDSRIPYEFKPEGTYAIQIDGTELYLTKKPRGNGDYCYAGFCTYDDVIADINRNVTLFEDYSWSFTFKTITSTVNTGEIDETTGEDIMYTSEQYCMVYGEDEGYACADGYIVLSQNTNSYTPIHLYKYNPEDELFAISTRDGQYWKGSFAWKSPYNKVDTSNKPQYLFRLSDTVLKEKNEEDTDAIVAASAANQNIQAYYSLDGRRMAKPERGIVIVKMADGSVKKMLKK